MTTIGLTLVAGGLVLIWSGWTGRPVPDLLRPPGSTVPPPGPAGDTTALVPPAVGAAGARIGANLPTPQTRTPPRVR